MTPPERGPVGPETRKAMDAIEAEHADHSHYGEPLPNGWTWDPGTARRADALARARALGWYILNGGRR